MWAGIPALVGGALARLPGLPLAGAMSISSALQRRLLSYLIRRTLGHLLKPGSLDGAQIDAGIGSGKLEIANLELDQQVSGFCVRTIADSTTVEGPAALTLHKPTSISV